MLKSSGFAVCGAFAVAEDPTRGAALILGPRLATVAIRSAEIEVKAEAFFVLPCKHFPPKKIRSRSSIPALRNVASRLGAREGRAHAQKAGRGIQIVVCPHPTSSPFRRFRRTPALKLTGGLGNFIASHPSLTGRSTTSLSAILRVLFGRSFPVSQSSWIFSWTRLNLEPR